jgi:D-psicose/D-tagatose/L-ribulose 3-epimerase
MVRACHRPVLRTDPVNRIGIHALVWVGTWGPEACDLAVANSKEAGYDLIEFPVFDPSALDVPAITRSLAAHDLDVTCSLGLSRDTDISSADPEIAARGERLLEDVISVTRDLGSRFIGGVIYSALMKYGEMPTERGRQHAVDALRRLAQKAAASDITLGLEIVNRYETNVLNTAAQAIAFIEDIGAANVVVHLDTYHMNIEETDFRSPVLTAGSRLGYVHVGESFRGYLGTGTVDFPQLFGALAEVGYDGIITFESFSSAVVDPGLSRTLGIWRNVWTDGMDLAREARRFIGEQLAAAGKADAPGS